MGRISNIVFTLEFLIGFLVGFAGNILASWVYDWLKKRSRENKQENFIEELNDALSHYSKVPPKDEAEVKHRREDVKGTVLELSQKIFKKKTPPIKSIRPETAVYPPVECRWCHRSHNACIGSQGTCENCPLPFDLWISSQVKPKSHTDKS